VWRLIQGDNKFPGCAVALNSKIIISRDKHLKDIKKYINIVNMSPRNCLFPLISGIYTGKIIFHRY